jgi:hypothetical protein
LSTPLPELIVPLPSFKPPAQWALALRCINDCLLKTAIVNFGTSGQGAKSEATMK